MHLGLCGPRPRPPPPAPMGACSRHPRDRSPPPQQCGGPGPFHWLPSHLPTADWQSVPSPAPHPPPFCVVNPCAARFPDWVLRPPPAQTDWVPAGPSPVAARVGVRPAGHPPAFQAQSGFVGPAGDWLGARRLVENLVSAERGGERRAAPPPLRPPARPPGSQHTTTHSLPALAPFHPQAPIPLSTCILLFSQSPGLPPPNTHLSPPSFSLAPPAYPTLAWLTLTHPDAIFRPPSL